MAAIRLRGAWGPKAHLINGYYMVEGTERNGAPAYHKIQHMIGSRDDIWLVRAENCEWILTTAEIFRTTCDHGYMYSEEALSPFEATSWKVFTGGEAWARNAWEEQEIIVEVPTEDELRDPSTGELPPNYRALHTLRACGDAWDRFRRMLTPSRLCAAPTG